MAFQDYTMTYAEICRASVSRKKMLKYVHKQEVKLCVMGHGWFLVSLQCVVVYLPLTNNGRITSSHVNDSRWISNSSTAINNEIKALEIKTLNHVAMLSFQAIYFPPTDLLRC
jgi:hypothetical protein